MSNLTTVTLTSGVATAGTGTVSTIDNMLGIASTPSSNVLTVQGSTGMTPFLITVGTTTTAAAVKGASTAPIATDPALVVAISPNSVNSNGRKTPANSAPVVINSMVYATVASTQTAQGLGATGAVGDYLDGVLIVPATTSPGAVSVLDTTSTSISVFAGGASSVGSLVPFYVPIGAISANGQWKITTSTNVSVVAIGNFT